VPQQLDTSRPWRTYKSPLPPRFERPTVVEQLGEDLHIFTQPFFPLPGSPTSADNRMTVLRMRCGDLWVRLAALLPSCPALWPLDVLLDWNVPHHRAERLCGCAAGAQPPRAHRRTAGSAGDSRWAHRTRGRPQAAAC